MKRNTFILAGLAALGFPLSAVSKSVKPKTNPVIEFTPEILTKNNFGLFLIKDTELSRDVTIKPSYCATVAFKLGYQISYFAHTVKTEKKVFDYKKYGIINFLTDGWFYPIANTKEEICDWLNNNPRGGKFRILTREELDYILTNRGNSKQLFG